MFGTILTSTSRDDLDALIKKDSRYLAAIEGHQFVIEDRGAHNPVLGVTSAYYGPRYTARIKCCYAFAKWANESGLFDEKEMNDLLYWVTKDNL